MRLNTIIIYPTKTGGRIRYTISTLSDLLTIYTKHSNGANNLPETFIHLHRRTQKTYYSVFSLAIGLIMYRYTSYVDVYTYTVWIQSVTCKR